MARSFALPLCEPIQSAQAVDLTPLTHVRLFGSLEKRFSSHGLFEEQKSCWIRQRLMEAMGCCSGSSRSSTRLKRRQTWLDGSRGF